MKTNVVPLSAISTQHVRTHWEASTASVIKDTPEMAYTAQVRYIPYLLKKACYIKAYMKYCGGRIKRNGNDGKDAFQLALSRSCILSLRLACVGK